MKRLLILFNSVLFIVFSGCDKKQELSLDKVRKSIFKILVISAEPKFSQPWVYKSRSSSSGSGFYIGKNRILTNAHVVSHGKYIRVQKDGDDQPRDAVVEFIAHDCDLAILKLEDPKEYFKNSQPLKFGELPNLRDHVATIGYPRGGEQISVTEGIVSRISFRRYAHTSYDFHLLVQVDSAINPGNSGGPVMLGNKVVGVAFQAHTKAENTGYIIPTPVVRRFLKDVEDGSYEGHPEDGLFSMDKSMENEGTLKYFGLKKAQGVKVDFVAEYSAFHGLIKKDDVILKINDYEIGVDGKINFQDERIDFKVIYDLSQVGDQIHFEVWRDKKIIPVEITMIKSGDYYKPENLYTLKPRYLVFGGLVFTALSRNYLKVWGSSWYQNAPLELRYIHNYSIIEDRYKNSRDIIILSEVLPTEANIMAENFKEKVLDSVDGVAINSLEELEKNLFEGNSSDMVALKFWNSWKPLIVDRKKLSELHRSLLAKYKVQPSKWLGNNDQDGAISGKSL